MHLSARTRAALRAGILFAALALPGCTLAIGSAPDGPVAARPTPPREAPAPRDEAPRWHGGIAPGASLLIPVRGIRPEELRDSFHEGRSGGRRHNAIDIMAPRGTPILAAADGTIVRLRQGSIGGIALYHLGSDGRTMYYYAHMQAYAAGIREGVSVRQGDVIGYVGDTGNAAPGNYHLHFSVSRLRDPSRMWEGENVNPYPLLVGDATRRSADR